MIKRLRHLHRNQKGYTLVELMVSFTLTAIFMTAAVLVMSSFLKVYYRTNNIAQTTSVSDMLMENITSELSLAALSSWDGSEGAPAIQITKGSDEKDSIGYCDKNGNSVIMNVSEGRIQLKYLAQVENGAAVTNEINWGYTDNVYVNNEITKLTFNRDGNDMITVELSLYNKKTGYTDNTKRVIKCFNMESSADIVQSGT